jgi:hypothetical protein
LQLIDRVGGHELEPAPKNLILLMEIGTIFGPFRILPSEMNPSQRKMKKTSGSTVIFSRLALIPVSFCGTERRGLGVTHSRANVKACAGRENVDFEGQAFLKWQSRPRGDWVW